MLQACVNFCLCLCYQACRLFRQVRRHCRLSGSHDKLPYIYVHPQRSWSTRSFGGIIGSPQANASLRRCRRHEQGLLQVGSIRLTVIADTIQAISELRQALSDESISTDEDDLIAHGYSEWSTTNIKNLPIAVAYPKSTREVSQIAKACHKYRIPISTQSRSYSSICNC